MCVWIYDTVADRFGGSRLREGMLWSKDNYGFSIVSIFLLWLNDLLQLQVCIFILGLLIF